MGLEGANLLNNGDEYGGGGAEAVSDCSICLEGVNLLNNGDEFGGGGGFEGGNILNQVHGGGGAEEKPAAEDCSICLDAVTDEGKRSWAMLQCSHQFHLDCIGSAFNAKKSMQCPNCRNIKKGEWLYSDESRLCPENGLNRHPGLPEDQFHGTAAPCCSICKDVVKGRRSWAKLKCSHQFHLECIGSVFNARGAMQCPNCHNIEKGRWLYAKGLPPAPGDGIHRNDSVFICPPLWVMWWNEYRVVPIYPSQSDQGEIASPTTYTTPTLSSPHSAAQDEACHQQSGNQAASTQASRSIISSGFFGTRSHGRLTSSGSSETRSGALNNIRNSSSRRGYHHQPPVYEPPALRLQNMHQRYRGGGNHSRNRR